MLFVRKIKKQMEASSFIKAGGHFLELQAVAGASWGLDHLFHATTAEATALQKGLQLIKNLACAPVVIETHSLELVQAYNGVIEIWSPYTAILADCFQRVPRICQVSVQHCFRVANGVAHH